MKYPSNPKYLPNADRVEIPLPDTEDFRISIETAKKDQESSKLLALFLCLFKNRKKNATPIGVTFFGDPEQTRTVDLQRDRLAC